MFAQLKRRFFPVGRDWAAFDPEVACAVLVRMGQTPSEKPRLLSHALLLGADLTESTLNQLDVELGSGNAGWVMVTARKDYQIFQLEKPSVRAEEMPTSLMLALTSLIDYSVTEVNLSWLEVPTPEGQLNAVKQLFVTSAKRPDIDRQARMFADAALQLEAADIRETAQRNLSARIETPDGAVCMVFADKGGVQLTLTHHGQLLMQRYIREALFGEINPEATWSLDQKIDRVANEIQRSLNFIQRNFAGVAVQDIWVGPQWDHIDLVARLQPGFIQPVRHLDLSDIFEFPEGSAMHAPEVQAQHFYALGASLRFSEGVPK